MNSTVTKKNRTTLILTLLAFIIPVALAYLVHATGMWEARGTVNKGQLINPPIDFDKLSLLKEKEKFDRKEQWWIVYAAPKQCETACQNSLYQIRQSHIATGPYKSRVSMLFVNLDSSDPTALNWVQQNAPDMEIADINDSEWNQHMESASLISGVTASDAGQIYIVDPMGAIFMTYPSEPDEKQSIQQGKGIVKDLQRVLKLSRIG